MLFDFAYERFKLINHGPGALVAAIGGVIAAVRAGEKDKASADLENKVRPTYQMFAPDFTSTQLGVDRELVGEAIAKKTDAPERSALAPDWADWLAEPSHSRAQTASTVGTRLGRRGCDAQLDRPTLFRAVAARARSTAPDAAAGSGERIGSIALDAAVGITAALAIVIGLNRRARISSETRHYESKRRRRSRRHLVAPCRSGASRRARRGDRSNSLGISASLLVVRPLARVKARSQRPASRSRNAPTGSVNWLLSKRTLKAGVAWPAFQDDSIVA